jgi:hypothetical protein
MGHPVLQQRCDEQRERKHLKKKTEKATEGNELRPEYDLSKLKGGVRGKGAAFAFDLAY